MATRTKTKRKTITSTRALQKRQIRVEQRTQWQRKFYAENIRVTPGMPSTRIKIKQKVHEFRSQFRMGRDRLIKSSWIKSLSYDATTQTVQMYTRFGKGYEYMGVPVSIFNDWWEGKATCKTSDFGKKKQWWVGKTPSLGAFYNKKIKGKFSSRKI